MLIGSSSRVSRVGSGVLAAAALVSLLGCQTDRRDVTPVSYENTAWKYGPWDGRKLTTAHYEIYTTVTDPVLIEMFPGLVERSYEYYQELIPPSHPPSELMKVYLFSTRSQWAHMTRRHTGARAEVFLKIRGGGFSERGVSIIQYSGHQVTFPLLAHEGFHQYLYHCVRPEVPAWLNEGLAVTCEGQRWTTSGLKEFDRWYNPKRENRLAESLSRDRLFPLKELLDTHAGNVVHETSTRVGTYYAQVWALMLFLWEGQEGQYAAGFEQLRQALRDPDLGQRLRAERIWAEGARLSPGEALFRSFISDDVDTVQREYLAFLRQRILHEH